MGKSKSSTSTSGSSSSTTTATPSPWEQQFDPTLMSLWQGAQPMISGITGAGGNLSQSLLGGAMLPGAYSGATGLGATPYGINQSGQDAIVNESMRKIPASLQATGMLDSGASQALYARGAQNVLSNVAQFNTGAQQSAMGLGSQIGTAAMQPAFNSASMLTSLLPGLRTINNQTTSNQQSNTTSQQPLSQTIGQLSSAFGTGSGGGNFVNFAGNAMAGSGFPGNMAQMMTGQQAQQNSLAGTIQGGGGGQGSGGGAGGGLAGFANGGDAGSVFSDPQTYAQILQIMAMMG